MMSTFSFGPPGAPIKKRMLALFGLAASGIFIANPSPVSAFVVPSGHHSHDCSMLQTPAARTAVTVNARVAAATPRSSVASPFSTSSSLGVFPSAQILLAESEGVVSSMPEDAFTDEVNLLSDPIIQTIVVVFVLVMALLVLAKNAIGEMDKAIENVLVDFESTLRKNHVPRWTNIELRLEKCATEEERAQKLFEIMETLEKEEPEFMARLKEEMKQGV